MATIDPRLPAPFAEAPNESEEEQNAWEASIAAFVTNLVLYKLSPETTAAQLFALFDAPEHQPLLFYYACAELLKATREFSDAGEHIALVAALFGLLKAEGLKRDGPDGHGGFGNAVVFPTIRGLAGDIPAPPGYKYDQVAFALERDPEYVQGDSFRADLAEYARNHEGQLRLWSLVGRLDADGFLGSGKPGTMPLLFHQAPGLLRALEDPVNRGVWETLWAAVLRGDEEMAYGEWGAGHPDWLGPFKDAVRKIIGDERAPLEWRGRFAVILEELEKER
ncbi:hypothetical protein DFH08DRAFT_10695 [Mycena albidolilacea]|uniref:Uncharacterized protein n=1 Tax=Mycena albidolilacea TaxID=1033008 RepID=A0AAD7ATT4_9AGAR|nr:hypothetical protein DFH08DRAFT_10695 [Mycena albidolilacea]